MKKTKNVVLGCVEHFLCHGCCGNEDFGGPSIDSPSLQHF